MLLELSSNTLDYLQENLTVTMMRKVKVPMKKLEVEREVPSQFGLGIQATESESATDTTNVEATRILKV